MTLYDLERMWVFVDSQFLNHRCLAYSSNTPLDMPPDGCPCHQWEGRLVLSLARLPDPIMASRGQEKISNATRDIARKIHSEDMLEEERFDFFGHNLEEKRAKIIEKRHFNQVSCMTHFYRW